MIRRETIEFLKKLDKINNRDWFQANKKTFDTAQANLVEFSAFLIGEIGKFDDAVVGIDPLTCVFRIYRDVRFSKDKSPYKVNLGTYISPGGRRSMQPGYYFHVQPGHSFVAGGKHLPDGPELLKIRTAIADNADEFLKIVNKKSFVEGLGELWPERLRSVPKGFDPDHKAAEFLKLKEFMVQRELTDKVLTSPDFPKQVVKTCKEMYPLIAFLRKALSS